eukprot:CAMPEP_0198112682 /NCGR_PEP_ID=MMETSP1442-20131203/4494_1 /TAXON_ID= /ORGANISM="Craspedostauros australis, Strain CCMP3328" /LENGTH=276 /DNA_ID=CAMNT_0043769543 /DNA_START=150 /DNA_END=980 /DNA_ORIENTATION=-
MQRSHQTIAPVGWFAEEWNDEGHRAAIQRDQHLREVTPLLESGCRRAAFRVDGDLEDDRFELGNVAQIAFLLVLECHVRVLATDAIVEVPPHFRESRIPRDLLPFTPAAPRRYVDCDRLVSDPDVLARHGDVLQQNPQLHDRQRREMAALAGCRFLRVRSRIRLLLHAPQGLTIASLHQEHPSRDPSGHLGLPQELPPRMLEVRHHVGLAHLAIHDLVQTLAAVVGIRILRYLVLDTVRPLAHILESEPPHCQVQPDALVVKHAHVLPPTRHRDAA